MAKHRTPPRHVSCAIAIPLPKWLAEELAQPAARCYEIASGNGGNNAVHFAARFPALHWQPSDPFAGGAGFDCGLAGRIIAGNNLAESGAARCGGTCELAGRQC